MCVCVCVGWGAGGVPGPSAALTPRMRGTVLRQDRASPCPAHGPAGQALCAAESRGLQVNRLPHRCLARRERRCPWHYPQPSAPCPRWLCTPHHGKGSETRGPGDPCTEAKRMNLPPLLPIRFYCPVSAPLPAAPAPHPTLWVSWPRGLGWWWSWAQD